MPFSETSTVRFGDGADEASSTELGSLSVNASLGEVTVDLDGVTPNVIESGTNVAKAVREALSVRTAYITNPVTAPQARKFDIGDKTDESELELRYFESDDRFEITTGASGNQPYSPLFLEGLELALTASGF